MIFSRPHDPCHDNVMTLLCWYRVPPTPVVTILKWCDKETPAVRPTPVSLVKIKRTKIISKTCAQHDITPTSLLFIPYLVLWPDWAIVWPSTSAIVLLWHHAIRHASHSILAGNKAVGYEQPLWGHVVAFWNANCCDCLHILLSMFYNCHRSGS